MMEDIKLFWDNILKGDYNKSFKMLSNRRRETDIDIIHGLTEYFRTTGRTEFQLIPNLEQVKGSQCLKKWILIFPEQDMQIKFTAVKELESGRPCPKRGIWRVVPISVSYIPQI